MKVYKCDRCGATLHPLEARFASVKYRGTFHVLGDGFDMCMTCKRQAEAMFRDFESQFRTWMKTPPEEQTEPEEPEEPQDGEQEQT